MTSKFIVGGCAVSFLGIIAVTYIVTEPVGDLGAPSLILGSNGDSDVLILTSKSAALLPPQVNNVVDLWGISPVEFLKALKMERASTYPYYFREPIKHWISKKDLPGLLALTDSNEPCAAVALMMSPRETAPGSTLGQQALVMIEGCREEQYPPPRGSGGLSADELINWCRNEIAKPGN